jgi:hypothetical protein
MTQSLRQSESSHDGSADESAAAVRHCQEPAENDSVASILEFKGAPRASDVSAPG